MLDACAAKVYQLQAPVLQHHDIIRADIPVENAAVMQMLQGLDNRPHLLQNLGIIQPAAAALHILLQCLSLQVLQHHVGSIILMEEILHPDNARQVIKLCQQPGLLDKLIPVDLVHLHGGRIGYRPGEHRSLPTGPEHMALNKELLYCLHALEHHVEGNIGNAEAAGAQHSSGQIPAMQDRKRRQRKSRPLIGFRMKAAVWAYIHRMPLFAHTVNT